ncbi:hypothetical protein [Streptomyces cucumeris]|uniref:hypothetical protein n=1 Tax=Streptomyces cucumeris TaxID=2962890 RepID=UPI003D73DF6D
MVAVVGPHDVWDRADFAALVGDELQERVEAWLSGLAAPDRGEWQSFKLAMSESQQMIDRFLDECRATLDLEDRACSPAGAAHLISSPPGLGSS